MANSNENNGIDWGSLVLGIIFIIAALVAFRNPSASLTSVVIIAGLVAILKGIGIIIRRNQIKERTNRGSTGLIVAAVIYIIIGIIILLNIRESLVALPLVFGIWFIVDGVADLIFSDFYNIFGTGVKVLHIIASIIQIVLGVLVIVNPLSAYFTVVFLVGFALMMMGIRLIILAFL